MLRSAILRVNNVAVSCLLKNTRIAAVSNSRGMSSSSTETDEEYDARYVAYLSRKDIDGWEVRKAINDMVAIDNVPDPKVIIACLHACRRINDYGVTTRFLEAIKEKCGRYAGTIYPYIIQEIQPTLDELGISTPEEMGYGKPELALESVFHFN